jgi:hypothetical protein
MRMCQDISWSRVSNQRKSKVRSLRIEPWPAGVPSKAQPGFPRLYYCHL